MSLPGLSRTFSSFFSVSTAAARAGLSCAGADEGAADEAGVLVWYEIPNWDKLTADSKRRGMETLRGMVERDWNHPSIVIVSIINESWGANLKEAADLAKLRLFTGLTVDESADALRISRRTGFRLWTYARAFLQAELSADDPSARA